LPAAQRLEGALVEDEVTTTESDGTGSFKMANRELREETLQMLGAISYYLADGGAVDRIGNEVILA
jgi:hypothetical protein